MLLDYDPSKKLYIFGDQCAAKEIKYWVEKYTTLTEPPQLVNREQFLSLPDQSQCMIGFSHNKFRRDIFEHPVVKKRHWVGFVHPDATVCEIESLGKGVIVQPLGCIGWGVTMGDFCWITSQSHVGHGAQLGTSVILNPNSVILGATSVGSYVTIGAGSILADRITITDDCEFLMGSTVTKSVLESGRYFGNRRVPE